MSKLRAISDLSFACVDQKPRRYDWSAGYGETWEFYEATRCETCGAAVSNLDDEHAHKRTGRTCDGYVPQPSGPAMNFFYPLPEFHGNPTAAAAVIVDVPLCLVRFVDNNDCGLALTGGGMDLSWEICETHMLLGYLPPVHFADLPEDCRDLRRASNRWILSGVRRALDGERNRMERALERLEKRLGKM